MAERKPIDFVGLAARLLQSAETLLADWLPGGTRRGNEYVCADLSGGEGGSLSVKLSTGQWGDFSTDDRGGDLISLYAAIKGLNNAEAALELMGEPADGRRTHRAPAAVPGPAAPAVDGADAAAKPGRAAAPAKAETIWRPIAPVPPDTPAPTFKHFHRGVAQVVWEYRWHGQLYGYVCRFPTSDGGKEILPFTWCEDTSDGRGTRKWQWKQWAAPRPLYVPAGELAADPAARPVLLVEGEKCADAAHALLGDEFDLASWPGGGKAWPQAALAWLAGRRVIGWPDCDSKRAKPTAADKAAGVDPATLPLLPQAKQPGYAAMSAIGAHLVAQHGCTYLQCPIPAPGVVLDGWDIADAIAQGWDAEALRAFIRAAVPLPDDSQAPAGPAPSTAGARPAQADGGGPRPETWRDHLQQTEKYAVKACRENVVVALDGVPERRIAGVPEAAGVVAYNEFTNDVLKAAPAPWGTGAGVWQEEDELELGHWLVHHHRMPPMPRGTLEEAVLMVAKRHRFHPVRTYLESLRGTWDGTKRLGTWLRLCCSAPAAADQVDPLLDQYLARVGTWFVMAMCARVMRPGSKFDYMLILEGGQGLGKSTLARTLGGAWFADTGLVLGEKDSYQNLQGIWVYEWGELDSLSRAEVTKVKQFVSSSSDRFRASFDRRPADYPRQVVFIGTTNEDHYLVDPTGNRRFWPVQVGRQIDIPWLVAHRDQLFAEALVYLDAGERYHPIPAEQKKLFDPQQQMRTVEGAIESAVVRYLYDENQRVPHMGENGSLVREISCIELLQRIGIGLEKLGPGRWHEKQAAAALRKLGWSEHRSSRAGRPRVYVRPLEGQEAGACASQSARHDAGAQPEGAASACPF